MTSTARLLPLAMLLAASTLGAQSSPAVPAPPAAPPVPPSHPTLAVLITIDQFRADYLDRFGPQLTGGLARLVRGGARFTNAHHGHAITETAPGHATLLSGRFPRSTGIMMNRLGVEDDSAALLGEAGGASPRRFKGTTLVDWVHQNDPRSRVLSVSMKDRAAILPVGRSRGDVYWYHPSGRFTTSRWYRDSLPPWVTAFNARHLPQSYAGRQWTLLRPPSDYAEQDTVYDEAEGSDIIFPHTMPDDPVVAANVVRGTPFMDDITVAFALEGISALGLGKGPQTDVLAISLSATDVIGHSFGPDSREMHDQVLRVDRAIGAFIDSLYRLRDSSKIVIALTSDHGVGTIPELAPAGTRPPATRVRLAQLLHPIRVGLAAARVDSLAVDLDEQLLFVNRAAFAGSRLDPDSIVRAFASMARRVPGVARVDRFSDLVADSLRDPIARRWAHQFPSEADVALVVTLAPLSTWGGNVASHGSPYDYDTHVPLIFYGAGIRPGVVSCPVRVVDLAPTLAAVLHVMPMERTDGVILRSALVLSR